MSNIGLNNPAIGLRVEETTMPNNLPVFRDVLADMTYRTMDLEQNATANAVGHNLLKTVTGNSEARWGEFVDTIRRTYG